MGDPLIEDDDGEKSQKFESHSLPVLQLQPSARLLPPAQFQLDGPLGESASDRYGGVPHHGCFITQISDASQPVGKRSLPRTFGLYPVCPWYHGRLLHLRTMS